MKTSTSILCLLALSLPALRAQERPGINYDEAKIGSLSIPDLMTCGDGSKVTTREQWLEKRRPELLALFEREEYGKTPAGTLPGLRVKVTGEDKNALGGKATKREVSIFFTDKDRPRADVLIYLPNTHKEPVPCFVGLNFGGNHSVTDDPTIKLSDAWFRDDAKKGYENHRATERTRGASTERWPLAEVIARGYGVCTAYYGDFEPDHPDGFTDGVRPLFLKPGEATVPDDGWRAIGAWAWGLSRMADLLSTMPEVDAKRLAVLGHSRLGKTSLWAGAQDPRFTIVISNDSGAGGAALHKRIFGETAAVLNKAFPHWFNGNFKKYSDNEGAMPMDQHELVALVAPRPVYIASATEDLWADPKGEFLGGKLAEPAYALFGKKGLGADSPPPPDKSIGDFIGYHSRTGKHNILLFDWEQYMAFADKHWGKPQ